MTAEHDLEPMLRSVLDERAQRLRDPYAGFAEMTQAAADTPQRRRRWWPFPLLRGSKPGAGHPTAAQGLRLVMAASIVALFGGFLVLTFVGGPNVAAPAVLTEPQSPSLSVLAQPSREYGLTLSEP